MDQQQQYTLVRENGRMYHADKETIDVLRAVQKWDSSAGQEIFARGIASGRIAEGSALEQAKALHQKPLQYSHGHDQ